MDCVPFKIPSRMAGDFSFFDTFIERFYGSIFGKGLLVLYARLYTAGEIHIKREFC